LGLGSWASEREADPGFFKLDQKKVVFLVAPSGKIISNACG